MKELIKDVSDTTGTLKRLIDLMSARELAQGARDQLADRRSEKADDKMDELVGAVHSLTVSHTESQRDNKEIYKAQERQEEHQVEHGKKLATHSEILAVHEVKINSSKSVLREVGGMIAAVIVAVVIARVSAGV